jgi:hypothetical protein
MGPSMASTSASGLRPYCVAVMVLLVFCYYLGDLSSSPPAPDVDARTEPNLSDGDNYTGTDALDEPTTATGEASSASSARNFTALFHGFHPFKDSTDIQACFINGGVSSFGGAGDSLLNLPLRNVVARWLRDPRIRKGRDRSHLRRDLPLEARSVASHPASAGESQSRLEADTTAAVAHDPSSLVRLDSRWEKLADRLAERQSAQRVLPQQHTTLTTRSSAAHNDTLKPAALYVPQVAMISRGYWDMLNIGLPPSATFDAVRDAVVEAVRVQRAMYAASTSRTVVYLPHCPQRAVQFRHTVCSEPHHVWMYRAAAACGALRAMETVEQDEAEGSRYGNGSPPVVVYDVCDLMRKAPGTVLQSDGGHFEENEAEPALADDLLQRVVCPAWAKQRGGERLTGTWSTAGMSYAEAKAAIDARFNCSAFRDSGKPVNNFPPRRPGPMPPRWRYCPVPRRELDAQLGWDFKPECGCVHDSFSNYDECSTAQQLVVDVLRRKKLALSHYAALDSHCSRLAHRGCVRQPPTGLPLDATIPGPLFDEIVMTACLRPEALPLCFLNLGSYIIGGFNATFLRTKFGAFANVSYENSFMVCGGARSCSNRTRPFAFAHNVSVTGSVGRCAAHEHAVALVRNVTGHAFLTCNKYILGAIRFTCTSRRSDGRFPPYALFHEVT